MIYKLSLAILAVVGLSLAVHAQEKETSATVQIRAVLHDPVHPTANLFYTDKTGTVVPLNFRPKNLRMVKARGLQEANISQALNGFNRLEHQNTVNKMCFIHHFCNTANPGIIW